MTWQLNDRELATVSDLPPARRYDYFVKRVADWGEVWSLRNDDGWVLGAGPDGTEHVPVWPHASFAAQCATGGWAGTEPAAIPIAAWLDRWLPGIERDGRAVLVFEVVGGDGVRVPPGDLRAELEEALSLVEDPDV